MPFNETSAGLGSLTKPVAPAKQLLQSSVKAAKANNIKAIKTKVSVKVKKGT